jgi:penicillin-binding protein 1A
MKNYLFQAPTFISALFTRRVRVTLYTITGIVLLIWWYVIAVKINPFNLFGPMPPMADLENPELDLSTEVISSDGVCLGRYYRENRSLVRYEQIPPQLVKTLIISEDHRFYNHSGLDLRSYLRVLKGMVTFEKQGGGSTLTQQVAKNLFRTRSTELQGRLARIGWPFEIIISKTKELIIAIELERRYTKEELIAMYLNVVPYHYKTFGIKAAAQMYFNKRLDELTLADCALLVGMLQGTYRFNPVIYPERAIHKRNEVMDKLYAHRYIKNKKTLDSLKRLPLKLNFSIPRTNGTFATHFVHNVLKQEMKSWCSQNGYDLFGSGLKIYVTLDTRIQALAQQAVANQMSRMQKIVDDTWRNQNVSGKTFNKILKQAARRTPTYKRLSSAYGDGSEMLLRQLYKKRKMRIFTWQGEQDTLFSTMDSLAYYKRILQCGLMSMNPATGEIKAWVGGIDFNYFQYDHVKQSKRQAGSTFKPFVFGVAMESGYSPCMRLPDSSPVITWANGTYQPKNYDGTYGSGEYFTLRQAMARSLNSITMQLLEKVHIENVIHFAQRMGITSKMKAVPSLALGTMEVSLFETVGAYAAFVNEGLHTVPFYVSRIEDRNGNILHTFAPSQHVVLDAATAATMVHLLKGGVEEEGGTSRALSATVLSNNQVGGKTGTTDDASDGWYIGITHNLVTGVWVGGQERNIHLPSSLAAGSRSALPVWDEFMREVYAHPSTGIRKGLFNKAALDSIAPCEEEKATPELTVF